MNINCCCKKVKKIYNRKIEERIYNRKGVFYMSKLSNFICKHKKIILIITLLLIIPSVIGMKATRINYDILVYLPEDIETIKRRKHIIRRI